MINIVGHTDNLPMRSNRFKSNWELSVARASSVARFLIDKLDMNPNQFVVSGYSSYRPIAPNTTSENRAKNRRVEIIISKRLPNPLAGHGSKSEVKISLTFMKNKNLIGLFSVADSFIFGFTIHGNVSLYFNLSGLLIVCGGTLSAL